jgi:hypothetical protein
MTQDFWLDWLNARSNGFIANYGRPNLLELQNKMVLYLTVNFLTCKRAALFPLNKCKWDAQTLRLILLHSGLLMVPKEWSLRDLIDKVVERVHRQSKPLYCLDEDKALILSEIKLNWKNHIINWQSRKKVKQLRNPQCGKLWHEFELLNRYRKVNPLTKAVHDEAAKMNKMALKIVKLQGRISELEDQNAYDHCRKVVDQNLERLQRLRDELKECNAKYESLETKSLQQQASLNRRNYLESQLAEQRGTLTSDNWHTELPKMLDTKDMLK